MRLWTRHDLLDYCQTLGFRRMAEVGVYIGKFSEHMLTRVPESTVWSIDPYKDSDGNFMWKVMREAIMRLDQYGARSRLVIAPSPQAASYFDDGFFDFVYIDADHRYEAVKADLAAWYPKVRKDGILAGDDWGDRLNGGSALVREMATEHIPDLGSRRVMRAVSEFVDEVGVELQLTVKDTRTSCPTWWFVV